MDNDMTKTYVFKTDISKYKAGQKLEGFTNERIKYLLSIDIIEESKPEPKADKPSTKKA